MREIIVEYSKEIIYSTKYISEVATNKTITTEKQLAVLTSSKDTTKTNTHNFCFENKLTTDQMITEELPSKYHKKFEHFLLQCKTIAIVK